MPGELGEYLARRPATAPPAGPVELLTATVSSWSAGNRAVNVLGITQPVVYAADVVGAITVGDTVAVLKAAGTHLLLCKIDDA
jgi:hypothetical protein